MTQSNLFLFYGDNQHQLKKELSHWKKSFIEKQGDARNLFECRLENNKVNYKTVLNEIRTVPFIADKKLIIIFNLNGQLTDKQLKQLENIPEFSIVVLVEEKKVAKNAKLLSYIKKIGQIKEFTISPSEIYQNALKILQKYEKKMQPQLLREFILKFHNSSAQIENELLKLILSCESTEISEKHIAEATTFSPTFSIFNLLDNISAKNIHKSLRQINDMIELGEDPIKLLYLIGHQINIMIQLKTKQPNTQLNIPPFIIRKTSPLTKNFHIKTLTNTLQQIRDIDIKIKTSKNDKTQLLIAIESVIFQLCE